MKLNITHPENASLKVVGDAIKNGATIHRSPHVGNVNNRELSLITGLCAVGATLHIELVDTIQGDDRYSNPRVVMVGDQNISLTSRKYAKNRIVGECVIQDTATDELSAAGLFLLQPAKTLKELHIDALRQTLPAAATIQSSSESFKMLGSDIYGLVLLKAAQVVERPLRHVTLGGKLSTAPHPHNVLSIYGMGENESEGLLPPLEAMMAIEIIKKIIESKEGDCEIVHIGGPDMIRYTKEDEVMAPTLRIAQLVLSELGIGSSTEVSYSVPCMQSILESPDFSSPIPAQVRSQHDLLVGNTSAEGALC